MTAGGALKIGDLGLARMTAGGDMSPHAVTLWYRAPEILWGSTSYDEKVDMWSAGCVCAEMHLRMRLFQGVSDVDQLGKIFHALGTPTDESWPGHRDMPCYVQWSHCPATPWSEILPSGMSEKWRDVVARAVVVCPTGRASAADFFPEDPDIVSS